MEKQVVVIEDDEAISDGLVLLLEKWQYSVASYPSVEAFDEKPVRTAQLFFVDKQLPGTDGLAFCRRLKSMESTSHVAVIIISANPDVASLSRDAGADAFLEKPFRRKQLLELLDRHLPPK